MTPARNINNTLTGEIIRLVCDIWGVSRADLTSRSRRRPLPWARAQLCEYLRRYAGHDTLSCAALIHKSQQAVSDYSHLYTQNRRTYSQFAANDENLKKQVKHLCNS